jgi:hypothetical protein
MNSVNQFEDRASRSRSMHEGESSYALCDRLSRTRDTSQRQLPTDHDYAVSTREYQTDQSSPKPAPAAARPVLENKNHPTDVLRLTGSLHISHFHRGCRASHCEQNAGILHFVQDDKHYLLYSNSENALVLQL